MTTIINASTVSGLVNSADTSGILQLQTASTAALTITAGQLVGIGTASPTVQLLNIAATSVSGPTNNPAGVQLTDSGASLSSQIVNRSGNTLHNVSSTKSHSFQVNSTETVGLNTYGIGLGATTPTSGMGITFPATQSASSDANTLDDYEEGTWSPTVTPAGGSLTSYTSSGTYTKIGRNVYVSFSFVITNAGTASGTATIGGFPFTSLVSYQQLGLTKEIVATGTAYLLVINSNSTTGVIRTFTNGAITWTNTYQYDSSLTYVST